jgi:pentatricopeptide repeat protein
MCFVKAGQYKEALAVMERMSGTGIKPDITMVRYLLPSDGIFYRHMNSVLYYTVIVIADELHWC